MTIRGLIKGQHVSENLMMCWAQAHDTTINDMERSELAWSIAKLLLVIGALAVGVGVFSQIDDLLKWGLLPEIGGTKLLLTGISTFVVGGFMASVTPRMHVEFYRDLRLLRAACPLPCKLTAEHVSDGLIETIGEFREKVRVHRINIEDNSEYLDDESNRLAYQRAQDELAQAERLYNIFCV